MSEIVISYGDTIIWGEGGILSAHPTPFFSRTVDYVQVGERWCQAETWTLTGTLIGCDETALKAARESLLTAFSSAFGKMKIADFDEMPIVEIQNIDIDDSDYIGKLPYSITFVYYSQASFSGTNHIGFYGVTNPSDVITYTENDDGSMDMNREISAKGFLTDAEDKNSAMDNAIAFVNYRKSKIIYPFLIKNIPANTSVMKYYLVSSEESYNRLTNDAKIVQKYKTDLTYIGQDVLHRYTVTEEESISQLTSVSYSGQIDVGRQGDMQRARLMYKKFKEQLETLFMITDEVTENVNIGRLTYRFSFYKDVDGHDFPKFQDDITISLKEDASSSLFTASINGSIAANYGCIEDRADEIRELLSSKVSSNYDVKSLIEPLYENFYKTTLGSKQNKPSNIFLHQTPLSKSEEFDKYNNTASYGAEFNDRYIPSAFAECSNFNLSVSVNFATAQNSIKEHYFGGRYICQDLGYNSRESVNCQLSREGVDTFAGKTICESYAAGKIDEFSAQDRKRVYKSSPSYAKSEEEKSESFSMAKAYNTEQAFDIL